VGQRAALQALEIWSGNPSDFATTTSLPSRYGMGSLDANDSNGADYKCNRFVAEVASAAGFGFPIRGWSKYPISAQEIYSNGIANTTRVNAKDAKIGDIISFDGHVGIYLGNGLYASARNFTDYLGRQVSDGVQITRVPWGQNPRVYRMNERQLSSNLVGGGNDSLTEPEIFAEGSQQNVAMNKSAKTQGEDETQAPSNNDRENSEIRIVASSDTKQVANAAFASNSTTNIKTVHSDKAASLNEQYKLILSEYSFDGTSTGNVDTSELIEGLQEHGASSEQINAILCTYFKGKGFTGEQINQQTEQALNKVVQSRNENPVVAGNFAHEL
jgi:hypothetical protein